MDRLVVAYLPLLYNIVGRAMNGHADVDDVVQETLLRVVRGLPGLRDPAAFRSWLVAIGIREVRGFYAAQAMAAAPAASVAEEASQESDLADLTILQLGLAGQRRETAEATRWLDQDDRDLLSLWWQETAGRLDRWRKREPRHARNCARCGAQREVLVPAERLLAGLPLLPVPALSLIHISEPTRP